MPERAREVFLGSDQTKFFDPELDGLTPDQQSWVIIEKGFKQVKSFLTSIGLEKHYERLMSQGIMMGYRLEWLTHENMEEYGITEVEERELIIEKREPILRLPEVKHFLERYCGEGGIERHWDSTEAVVFFKAYIDWPVFADAKERMKDVLGVTHSAQWILPTEAYEQYSSEGRLATASSCDGMIFLWPISPESQTPPCVRCVQAHFDICTDHVTDWERMRTVSVGGDHHIAIVDLEKSKVLTKIKNDTGLTLADNFISCDADLNAGKVIIGGIEGQVKVADVQTNKFCQHMMGHEDAVRSIRLDVQANQAFSASWDRTLKLWDLRSGLAVRTLHGHNQILSKMDVSFDLQMAMSCANEDKIILWDLKSGGAIHSYENWFATDVSVDWSGMRFASCGDSDLVLVWDLEQGTITQQIDAWDSILAQCIDVDWKRGEILVGTWDNQVLLFDMATEELIKTCKKAMRTVTRVQLNDPPDI